MKRLKKKKKDSSPFLILAAWNTGVSFVLDLDLHSSISLRGPSCFPGLASWRKHGSFSHWKGQPPRCRAEGSSMKAFCVQCGTPARGPAWAVKRAGCPGRESMITQTREGTEASWFRLTNTGWEMGEERSPTPSWLLWDVAGPHDLRGDAWRPSTVQCLLWTCGQREAPPLRTALPPSLPPSLSLPWGCRSW